MGRCLVLAFWLILVLVSPGAAQPGPRGVLILYSFESGFTSDATYGRIFRTELSRQSREPITFVETSLRPTPSIEAIEERSVVNYLQSSLEGRRLDLVVTIGAPAALFAQKYSELLFRETPIVWAGLDERWLRGRTLSARETAVTARMDPAPIVEDMLRLLPQTTNVFLLTGSSPVEKAWREEFSLRLQPLSDRVTLTWFNEQSFEEILKRSAVLPANSTILYLVLSVDATEYSYSEEYALATLHGMANAPMFGLYSNQLGSGVVGGPALPIEDLARQTSNVALRLLRGESAATVKTPPQGPGRPTYDWRELRRWGISETRLPKGSIVLFRQPSVWDQYKLYIVGGTTIFGLQSALIAGLVVQHARRRRTELALRESERGARLAAERNQDLAGRLITAQEAERRRIARELHDDLSQRLALLSIEIDQIAVDFGGAGEALPHARAAAVHLNEIAAGVHNLSHDLHPSRLEMLGLGPALRSLCVEVSSAHNLAIEFEHGPIPGPVPNDTALCLFRVAQEALRNVVKHSAARTVQVGLWPVDGMLELRVADSGRGFSLESSSDGLGLVSMRERVHFLGGQIAVLSESGRGTRIGVKVPVDGLGQRTRFTPGDGETARL